MDARWLLSRAGEFGAVAVDAKRLLGRAGKSGQRFLGLSSYFNFLLTCVIFAFFAYAHIAACLLQVPGRMVVKFGQNPGESIVDLAREERASLVVLGTRGLGTIRRTILGSVSDYVLHHVHCPVAICSHMPGVPPS